MKIIDKIMDDYYTKKLKAELSHYLLNWFVDKKFVETNECVQLQIKKQEFNDKQYKTIFSFWKEDAFRYLCMQETLKERIYELVDDYFGNNKEKPKYSMSDQVEY